MKFVIPAISLLLVSCATTKPVAIQDCKQLVNDWADSAPVQGMPQNDGGVVFVKPKLDGSLELLVLVSNKNAGTVMQEAKRAAQGPVIIKECAHPVNGYPYTVVQFKIAPDLKSAGN